ncbi:hypothetical protein BDV27DRAFT_137541 [Aspergillus caelatus]|uniref:Uncharacterized protein n=2 Tax=Aspergillus subgen. Circumdati TaxID=2720871 RepID=A0A5N6ZNK2_9EURO|nr:uncharacterized protein BDV27DRAFT_137541 [Aspergillus caelatus]KAE8358546.1 hypothetical protein BDV27DRAFT_137541 [Aspergillus caelatus]
MSFTRLSTRFLSSTRATPRLIGNNPIRTPHQIRLESTRVPRLAQASVWSSMIPKFIRNRGTKETTADTAKSKEWNPASFYIIIFILIGSQAIRMIALKNDYRAYTRTTDAKITLLREVIERVKNGEKVDVERLLGTGDQGKEREWEEILREIEEEDSLWHQKSKDQEPDQQVQSQERQVENSRKKDPVMPAEGTGNEEPPANSPSRRKINFF